MRPDGHSQEGTWSDPFATCGQPCALMVSRKGREGCIPRRKAYGHGGRSIPANDEPAHRFGGSARACSLMGSGISSEGFRDPRARLLPSRSSPRSSTGRAVPGHSTARERAQEKGRREREQIRPSKVSRARLRALDHRDLQLAPLPTNDSLRIHPNRRSRPQDPVAPFGRLVRSGAALSIVPAKADPRIRVGTVRRIEAAI